MHPLLARFLDLPTALAAADQAFRGEPVKPDERAFAQALAQWPDQRSLLERGRGHRHPAEAVQNALVFLATHAAAIALRDDPDLAAPLTRAELALRVRGASDAQVSGLIASVVLEEAFGYDSDPDRFDREFVRETLESLPALAALELSKLEQLRDRFIHAQPEARQGAAELAATALLEAAWGEGPEPVNPEHLEQARAAVPDADPPLFEQLLQALHHEGLIGPLRLARLSEQLAD